jgi:hypothetical protein
VHRALLVGLLLSTVASAAPPRSWQLAPNQVITEVPTDVAGVYAYVVKDQSGRTLWSSRDQPGVLPGAGAKGRVEVWDLDRDGLPEVIVAESRGAPPYAYRIWRWNGSGFTAHPVGSGILRGDDGEPPGPFRTSRQPSAWFLQSFHPEGQLLVAHLSQSSQPRVYRRAVVRLRGDALEVVDWDGDWKIQGEGEFLLPLALVQPLQDAHLERFSARELTLLRNALYAFNGRTFTDPGLRRYFQAQRWYQPRPDFSEQDMTEVQRRNAAFIADFQARRGKHW